MRVAYLKTRGANILWDVDKMIRDMERGILVPKIEFYSAIDLMSQVPPIDYDISKVNILRFPIIALLGNGKFRMLAGEEQVARVRQLSFQTISCCELYPRQHKKYILDYDEETYLRAVSEYWPYGPE